MYVSEYILSINKILNLFLHLFANQVVKMLAKYMPTLHIARAVGGDSIRSFEEETTREVPHIVVGTPGRVDHMIQV
jgi:superfamily II DNA/RNA helicase